MVASRAKVFAAVALTGAMLPLAGCDAKIVLWPWAEADKTSTTPAPPPPGPSGPATPADADTPTVPPTQDANSGAPPDGTPFIEKPVDEAIPISDSQPPVSAETGQPVTLPPAQPDPTVTEPSGPSTPSEPATPPATPPAAPPATEKPKPSFLFFRPGVVEPGSGVGTTEVAVLVPDMQFPIKDAPAFPQSQVYRWGGGVKGGDQCDARNFRAPWRDNFCETRSSGDTTFCSKKAHLGQDIRVGSPEGCRAEVKTKAADRARYEIVATEDGIISNVGSYSISLRANSGGRIYRYLHLNMQKLKVTMGQAVKKGDVLGYVSNDFGGTPTTLHLHFEIKLNTAENGWQYAPPYASLLEAYRRREGNDGEMVDDNFAVASSPR